MILNLVRVSKTTHARHNAEHVVVASVYADFGGVGALDGGVGENKLESGVINARHVACSRWLVFLWAEGKRVNVDACVRGTRVVLPWLHLVEVCAFTLRESVLTVKLKFGSYNWILAPAVHVERSFSENEGAGVRHKGGSIDTTAFANFSIIGFE